MKTQKFPKALWLSIAEFPEEESKDILFFSNVSLTI
jgi:hypothetical protein